MLRYDRCSDRRFVDLWVYINFFLVFIILSKLICILSSQVFSVKEEQDPAAFDEQSSSLIKLNNGTVLYLREVNKFLALVCILREDNFDHKGVTCVFLLLFFYYCFVFLGIIDYNFLCFREAIQQVFELRNKCQGNSLTNSAGSPIVNGNNILGERHLSPTLTDELGTK